MKKTARNVVALVATDDTPKELRGALEEAGYDVPQAYAGDLRGATTALSTFVETYKPDVIVLDLHAPVDDALKDILSLKSLRSARGTGIIFACSDRPTRVKLIKTMGAVTVVDGSPDSVLAAVKETLDEREAA